MEDLENPRGTESLREASSEGALLFSRSSEVSSDQFPSQTGEETGTGMPKVTHFQ